MVAQIVSMLPKDEQMQIPGFGAGQQPSPVGPLVTPLPPPDATRKQYGPPPLQIPSKLNDWTENVLEGASLDDARKWIGDFVLTYPASERQTISDLLIQSVQQNYVDGARRQQEVHQDLSNQYPNASVQDEQYLRDSAGNISIDPNTGTARRLDHVVIQDGKVVDVVETTSMRADKRAQMDHEANVRSNGGVYVRDRTTGELVRVPNISRVVRKP